MEIMAPSDTDHVVNCDRATSPLPSGNGSPSSAGLRLIPRRQSAAGSPSRHSAGGESRPFLVPPDFSDSPTRRRSRQDDSPTRRRSRMDHSPTNRRYSTNSNHSSWSHSASHRSRVSSSSSSGRLSAGSAAILSSLTELGGTTRKRRRTAVYGLPDGFDGFGRPRRRLSRAKQAAICCRRIVEHSSVVCLTTLLTLWVLVCDDVRIISTQKPADSVFEVILIVSLVVFGLEIVLTCAGKQDYFMSFFFNLDLISTGSLVFDLPSIQEEMAKDKGGMSVAEGRSARIGAKAARVVRIVRLVRIVKLYKILVIHFEKRLDKMLGVGPGDVDAEFLEDKEGADQPQKKESRVGKQLLHAILKRVIVLILAMLLVVPQLSASEFLLYPPSSSYGADQVWAAFTAMSQGALPQASYEQSLLRYIYYHNWFRGNGQHGESSCDSGHSCPYLYYNHLFWLGISGNNFTAVKSMASLAKLSPVVVDEFDLKAAKMNTLYKFGNMPSVILKTLGSGWDVDCSYERSGGGSREFMHGLSILSKSAGGKVEHTVACPSDLRAAEVNRYFPQSRDKDSAERSSFVFYFDQRQFLREDAWFSIVVTVYVCISLCLAVGFFSRDANRLVLNAVESMMARVEAIREDPLAAVKMGDDEFRLEEAERIRREMARARFGAGRLGSCLHALQIMVTCKCRVLEKPRQPMETAILERTLIKLASLLALGFGEAGAHIIDTNMASDDTADVDVMLAGERVNCVYGQAKIQDFSAVTEVLQSKVMQFVNQVSEIVHGVVVECFGAVNKNHGDTFFLVWRFRRNPDGTSQGNLVDMSVIAFCKILTALHDCPALLDYASNPKIKSMLGSRYRVKVNIGMHAGWSFEGAMGSEYKIDASYVSPNIAITSNLEQATLHYRVPVVISGDVVCRCSKPVADMCRRIDVVHIAGHDEPMDLHCLDIDLAACGALLSMRHSATKVDVSGEPKMVWNRRARYKVRQFLDSERAKNRQDARYAYRVLLEDPLIIEAREPYTTEFVHTFSMGLTNYLEGEWQVAQGLLQRACHALGATDGPSESLLSFLEQHQFEAPKTWRGHRDLGPLLHGPPSPPKIRPRPPNGPPVALGCQLRDFAMAKPAEDDNAKSMKASWQLPHAVHQEKDQITKGLPAVHQGKDQITEVVASRAQSEEDSNHPREEESC